MKESILDVLLYLFEHYIADDADTLRDRDPLQAGLIEAGFTPAEIAKAFDWLDGLAQQRPSAEPRCNGPVRVFHGPELDKLDVECRGFLTFLEQQGVLDLPPSASWWSTAPWPWTRTSWTWTTSSGWC